MNHRTSKHSFGRKPGPRKALIRGLVDALVENGRIKTTLEKAKEVRRHAEKAITQGKKGDVHCRRLLLQKFPNKKTVSAIVDDIAVRFKARPGGYTRILKLGPRPGDMAEMAYIEFVDFALPEVAGEETVKGDKEAKDRQRLVARRRATAKKKVRNLQEAARRRQRAR